MRALYEWIVDNDAKRRAELKTALKNIREGGVATKVRVLVGRQACPACQAVEGAYEFDDVPELPPEGCSCIGGCKAYYAPVLDLRGP